LKAYKALGALIMALQLAGLVVSVLSFHTLYSVLSSTVAGESFEVELVIDHSTGAGTLTLNALPRNGGFLGADLSMALAVEDADGGDIARDAASGHIGAGGARPFTLGLTLPSEAVQAFQEESGVLFEVAIEIRTLEGLVGVSNTLRLRGGGFE